MTVRTGFAPSPTGYLHIGGARTALYCWLESRHRGGEFVLRIEDTDRERSNQAAIDAILDAMAWLGLDYDEGPIYQTHRLDRYREVAEQLVAEGKAYYAYETREELEAMREAAMAAGGKPRYNGAYRERNEARREAPNRVIRFKNPVDGVVAWDDKVKGRIEIANSELDDLVIFRPDGYATYNFAVVVDDIDMRISDVVRGDDHVNNTRARSTSTTRWRTVPAFSTSDDPRRAGREAVQRTGAADVMQYRTRATCRSAAQTTWCGWAGRMATRRSSIAECSSCSRLATSTPRRRGWIRQARLAQQQYLRTTIRGRGRALQWHCSSAATICRRARAADIVSRCAICVQTLKDMAERAAVWSAAWTSTTRRRSPST